MMFPGIHEVVSAFIRVSSAHSKWFLGFGGFSAKKAAKACQGLFFEGEPKEIEGVSNRRKRQLLLTPSCCYGLPKFWDC